MNPKNFPGRKQVKRQEAQVRQEAYDKLSPEQKLKLLDEKLGKDQGASKERAKLTKLLGQSQIKVHGDNTFQAPVEPQKESKRGRKKNKRAS